MKTLVTPVTAHQVLVASPQLLTPLPRAGALIAIVRIRVVVAVIMRAIMTICNCTGTGNVHCPKAMNLTQQIGTKEMRSSIRMMLEKGYDQQLKKKGDTRATSSDCQSATTSEVSAENYDREQNAS